MHIHLAAVGADLIRPARPSSESTPPDGPVSAPMSRSSWYETATGARNRKIHRTPGEPRHAWVLSVPMVSSADVPMISIKGVNKHFGALHVLKDINLEVERGQVVVILGPSGSGNQPCAGP